MNLHFDTTAFEASIKVAKKTFGRLVMAAVSQAAKHAADLARSSGLYRQRTGRLAKSIRSGVIGKFHARASANAKHAAWVERGNTFRTGAAYIYPRTKKALKFNVDGATVFARRVRASKPRPYMAEAGRKTEPLFERLCRDAANRMFG